MQQSSLRDSNSSEVYDMGRLAPGGNVNLWDFMLPLKTQEVGCFPLAA